MGGQGKPAKRPARKEVEGLPEALGRGNRMKARSQLGKPEKVTEKQRTFGQRRGEPIVYFQHTPILIP
jgi:hypothetical protein